MQREQREKAPRPAEGDGKWVEVTLVTAQDVPAMYANQVIVNFTGSEFLVSVVAAFPEPWMGGPKGQTPKKITGKVLARFGLSIPAWAIAANSFNQQLERLTKAGVITVELNK